MSAGADHKISGEGGGHETRGGSKSCAYRACCGIERRGGIKTGEFSSNDGEGDRGRGSDGDRGGTWLYVLRIVDGTPSSSGIIAERTCCGIDIVLGVRDGEGGGSGPTRDAYDDEIAGSRGKRKRGGEGGAIVGGGVCRILDEGDGGSVRERGRREGKEEETYEDGGETEEEGGMEEGGASVMCFVVLFWP
jgi:hypothetical protein